MHDFLIVNGAFVVLASIVGIVIACLELDKEACRDICRVFVGCTFLATSMIFVGVRERIRIDNFKDSCRAIDGVLISDDLTQNIQTGDKFSISSFGDQICIYDSTRKLN